MSQGSLFPSAPSRWADTDPPAAAPAPAQTEHQVQEEQAQRVGERIDAAIVAWCKARPGLEFHMAELVAAVKAAVGEVAPDSPGRRLRALRFDGKVKVQLVSRAESLYRVECP